jgi:peptidoglycan/xylan/chitin deacetylase (PgdA/CDA1 family)
MSFKPLSKYLVCRFATLVGIDRMFRMLNRQRLLVVMYHGVTLSTYDPPIWTQLPFEKFREQIDFLRANYRIVTMNDVIRAIREGRGVPERAALITFDDGLKNNYTVAFPLLQRLGVPATIFLTVGLIGTSGFLWFDELYIRMRQADVSGSWSGLGFLKENAVAFLKKGKVWEAYVATVENIKRSGPDKRHGVLSTLRTAVPMDMERWVEDFGFLNWDEVKRMQETGLLTYGVHSSTHRVLTELNEAEWDSEIVEPKQALELHLSEQVSSFCFPNGRPRIDFRDEHLSFLRKAGYECAFSTRNALFRWPGGDNMSIGRIAAGNDGTSEMNMFRLNTSGAIACLRNALTKKADAHIRIEDRK